MDSTSSPTNRSRSADASPQPARSATPCKKPLIRGSAEMSNSASKRTLLGLVRFMTAVMTMAASVPAASPLPSSAPHTSPATSEKRSWLWKPTPRENDIATTMDLR